MSDLTCRGLTAVRNGQLLFSNVNLEIPNHQITGILGARHSGNYPLLRAFNRMLEIDGPIEISGQVLYQGREVYSPRTNVYEVRRQIVTIPAVPQPLPGSVYDHVSIGLRLRGWTKQVAIAEQVEKALETVGLWEHLKPRLAKRAASLPSEILPRLALATAIAAAPTHILWEEPGAELDPAESDLLYNAIKRLSGEYTFVFATDNPRLLARLSDVTVFMDQGRIIETGRTEDILERPRRPETEKYLTGQLDT